LTVQWPRSGQHGSEKKTFAESGRSWRKKSGSKGSKMRNACGRKKKSVVQSRRKPKPNAERWKKLSVLCEMRSGESRRQPTVKH